MRFAIAAGFLLGSAIAASAQTPAPVPPLPPPGVTYDVPAGSKPQTAAIWHVEIPAGTTNPVRVHPGVEMAYIASGDLEYWTKDKPVHVYHKGDALFIGRGVQYQVRVASKIPVDLYTVLITDKGVPPAPVLPGVTLIH